jgi:hypothetical protein
MRTGLPTKNVTIGTDCVALRAASSAGGAWATMRSTLSRTSSAASAFPSSSVSNER